MTPSLQQEAFYQALLHSSSSLALDARAGCGKTTTQVMGAKKISPGLALAFNVKIKDELKARLPDSWEVLTTNGLGHRAWGKHTGKKLNVAVGKIIDWAKAEKCPGNLWADLRRLCDFARSSGYVPQGAPTPKYQEDLDLQDIAEDLELEVSDELLDWGDRALRASISSAWSGQIDFADQLYMPIIYGASFPRYGVVMIDEAQDLSKLQHLMVAGSRAVNGRVLAAGDKHQAIYAFRGALAESFPELQRAFDMKILPLTASYRCPQAVVREAQAFVPDISAVDTAPEGSVNGAFDAPIEPLSLSRLRERPSAILCRNNAPLISLCFKLIREGVGATILGRDVAVGLIAYLKKHQADSMAELMAKVREDSLLQIAVAKANENENKLDRLYDRLAVVEALIEGVGPGASFSTLLTAIDDIFSHEAGRITLSTIHKAKGLEWPQVYILGPGLFRLSRGQDSNLAYVAVTRAQSSLTYLVQKPKLGA